MRTLPDLRRANADHHTLDLGLAVDLRCRCGLLGEAKRIADVFDTAGDADAPPQVRLRTLARMPLVAPALAHLSDTALQYLAHGHALRQRLLRRLQIALAVEVDTSHLDGIEAERVRQACHHDLSGELRLWPAETAESAAGNIVGVDGVAIDADVGYVITAAREERRHLCHLHTGRGIGAAIGNDLRLHGGDMPILPRAPAAADEHGMALVVADHRFFAAPDKRDWPLQFPGRQRQKMLDGEIFAPAEGASNRRVAHHNFFLRQPQHRRNLAPVLVHPLPGGLDHHMPLP